MNENDLGHTVDEHRTSRACPVNGAVGRAVAIRTIKGVLTMEALGRLSARPYFFCPDPACDTVYFDEHGASYARVDLRVPVYQKEPPGARLLCYCFGESETAIADEVRNTGRSEAVTRIRQHIAAGRCACDLRNPRGACCLGELTAFVADAQRRAGEKGNQ